MNLYLYGYFNCCIFSVAELDPPISPLPCTGTKDGALKTFVPGEDETDSERILREASSLVDKSPGGADVVVISPDASGEGVGKLFPGSDVIICKSKEITPEKKSDGAASAGSEKTSSSGVSDGCEKSSSVKSDDDMVVAKLGDVFR